MASLKPKPITLTRRFRWAFAAMLAALATLGPFSIDAYLPAFAGIQASLDGVAARDPADALGVPLRLRR